MARKAARANLFKVARDQPRLPSPLPWGRSAGHRSFVCHKTTDEILDSLAGYL